MSPKYGSRRNKGNGGLLTANDGLSFYVPQNDLSVIPSGQNDSGIQRVRIKNEDLVSVTPESTELFSGVRVPDTNCAVILGGDGALIVHSPGYHCNLSFRVI